MLNLAKFAAALSLAGLLSGCGTTTALIDTAALCKDWRVYRPSSKIAAQRLPARAAAHLLASNASRAVWGCAKTENEAA